MPNDSPILFIVGCCAVLCIVHLLLLLLFKISRSAREPNRLTLVGKWILEENRNANGMQINV